MSVLCNSGFDGSSSNIFLPNWNLKVFDSNYPDLTGEGLPGLDLGFVPLVSIEKAAWFQIILIILI